MLRPNKSFQTTPLRGAAEFRRQAPGWSAPASCMLLRCDILPTALRHASVVSTACSSLGFGPHTSRSSARCCCHRRPLWASWQTPRYAEVRWMLSRSACCEGPVRVSRVNPVPNPALNRTGRYAASTWRASARPAGWLVSLGRKERSPGAYSALSIQQLPPIALVALACVARWRAKAQHLQLYRALDLTGAQFECAPCTT
jgi:hypothetical protein